MLKKKRSICYRFLMGILPALLLVIAGADLLAADVTLVWDANTETDLAGYKVYYGTASRTYGTPIVIGTQTTYTVTGLAPGTYYFAVTAYNTSGLESPFSNEVSATIAQAPRCDINADQAVNVLDIQRLINVILGSSACPGNCDINADSRVDILDLQILANVILGVRSCP
jgi:hypothetical protein